MKDTCGCFPKIPTFIEMNGKVLSIHVGKTSKNKMLQMRRMVEGSAKSD